MRNTYVLLILKFLVGILGIICISAIPSLFSNGIHIGFHQYWETLSKIINSLVHAKDMVYPKQNGMRVFEYNVFPDYWSFYVYSLTIFSSAFGASLFIGLLLTFVTVLQSPKKIKIIVSVLSFLESIPDLLIITIFDFLVIFIFNKTGILLFNIAGAFERSYFVPILTLAVLPGILFFRIFLLAVLDEEIELYVELAKSKGLKKSRIILVHIYRNALITLCTHLKSIFFVLLSNLVIVEYVFNITGITWYIFDHPQPEILALSILLFFVPVYVIMACIRLFVEYLTGKKVVV